MQKLDTITHETTIKESLERFNRSGGALQALVDSSGKFLRVVTQGDIRRLLLDGASVEDALQLLPDAKSIFVTENATFAEVESLFAARNVDQIPVLDGDGRPVGLHKASSFRPILLSTPHLGQEELKFVNEAFDTNWIAPVGPNLDAFEKAITEFTGSRYAVALSSGTAAIHLALVTLGITAGDTVLCSSLTFAASANPIRYQGATPVFVDSDPNTWNMSASALEAAIEHCQAQGTHPKAVIVVNLYGQSADMDAICDVADRHGIDIIEDAAESLGATYKGRPSGTFGRVGIFSFNGNKIITTSGGGALISNEKQLVDKARYLSTQAREPVQHYEHREIGYNYRMSNVLAGIGRGQFNVLEQRIQRRREVFEMYRARLENIPGVSFMPEPVGFMSTRWLTALLVEDDSNGTASGLIAFLATQGVEARPVWKPMHLQPVFADCAYFTHGHNHSVSDALFGQGVCLPSGTNTPDDDILRVGDLIARYFEERD